MSGHQLGVLEPSVVLQVNRDASCPPGVTSNGGQKTRRLGPLPNSRPGVVPVWRSSGPDPICFEIGLRIDWFSLGRFFQSDRDANKRVMAKPTAHIAKVYELPGCGIN